MALIDCPDCEAHVSERADHCLSCGYPIRASREYLEQHATAARQRATEGPAFLLQAIPLVGLQVPLDVQRPEVQEAIRGRARNRQFDSRYSLTVSSALCPTLFGMSGRDYGPHPHCMIDVHTSGYIGVLFLNRETMPKENVPLLHGHFQDLFRAFGALCNSVYASVGVDVDTIYRCHYFGARGSVFWEHRQTICEEEEISWPECVRRAGEPHQEIADVWGVGLYHAFGERYPENP